MLVFGRVSFGGFHIKDSTLYLSILVGVIPISHDETINEETNLLEDDKFGTLLVFAGGFFMCFSMHLCMRLEPDKVTWSPWFLYRSHGAQWMIPHFSKKSTFLLNSLARFRNQRAWFTCLFIIWWKSPSYLRNSRWMTCYNFWRYCWWMRTTPHLQVRRSPFGGFSHGVFDRKPSVTWKAKLTQEIASPSDWTTSLYGWTYSSGYGDIVDRTY